LAKNNLFTLYEGVQLLFRGEKPPLLFVTEKRVWVFVWHKLNF